MFCWVLSLRFALLCSVHSFGRKLQMDALLYSCILDGLGTNTNPRVNVRSTYSNRSAQQKFNHYNIDKHAQRERRAHKTTQRAHPMRHAIILNE